MNLLIDTCGAALILGVATGHQVHASCVEDMQTGQAEAILPALDETLRQAGLRPGHPFDKIGVTVGPGSFTGLRIGLAVARARAAITQTPIAELNRLQVVAAAHPHQGPKLVSLDARRSERFVQLFSGLSDPLTQPSLAANADVGALYGQWPGAAVIDASGRPDAFLAAMAALTHAAHPQRHDTVMPLYVRPPDAKAQVARFQTTSAVNQSHDHPN